MTTYTIHHPTESTAPARLTFPLADIVHHVKPSISIFTGNRSADPAYITDGRILLWADAVRTPGRARRLAAHVNELDRRATTEQLQQVCADATGVALAPLEFLGLESDPADADKKPGSKYYQGPFAIFRPTLINDNFGNEIFYRARYLSLVLDYLGPDKVQLWSRADDGAGTWAGVITPIVDSTNFDRYSTTAVHCTTAGARFNPTGLIMPVRRPRR